MSTRLYGNKHLPQCLLRVRSQYSFNFTMHRSLRRWQHPKIKYTRKNSLDKNQVAEISIPRYEDTSLFLSHSEQLLICCLGQTYPRHGNNVMSETAQKTRGIRIHVLVEQELHASTVVR
jgi:hypothetical protein